MDYDDLEDWKADNEEELIKQFLDTNGLTEDFDKFCEEQFDSALQSYSDYLYDMYRDAEVEIECKEKTE